jgi:hypothetical protein
MTKLRSGPVAREDAWREQAVNRFIAELIRYQAEIQDPVERLLCVAASLGPEPGDWIHRCPGMLDAIEDTLRRPHPIFDIEPEAPRILIRSSEAFISWVFHHPRAKRETLKVMEWSRLRHWHTVASTEAVRITGDRQQSDFDSQRPTHIPGLMMLSNGIFCSSRIDDKAELKRLTAQPTSPIASDRMTLIAAALDIPIARYS